MKQCNYLKHLILLVPFNNAWYSFTSNNGSIGDFSVLSNSCVDWFHYNGKKVSDVYFLNYNWGANELCVACPKGRCLMG